MQITEYPIGDAMVLDLRGKLTGIESGELFEQTVDRLARTGWRTIVANLEEVSAIDARGLGALVDAYRASRRNFCTLRLIHVTRRIHNLIVITRLATVLEMFDSLVDALLAPHSMPSLPAAELQGASRSLAPIHSFSGHASSPPADC